MDIISLVKLTSRAWSLSILARMHSGTPGRQATLLAATGAGRTAFSQSLAHLIEIGMLERNPGHGHPLRPEFRLTKTGGVAAMMAAHIYFAAPMAGENALLRRAWSIPILAASRTPRYFTEIKNDLTSIGDRALSQSIKRLETQNWITRTVDTTTRPPRPLYQACNAGARIGSAVHLAS